jgi:hypothetical protein
VTIISPRRERFDARRLRIVFEDTGNRVDKGPFTVCAGTVAEEERMLGRDAGQRISKHPLHISYQFSVSIQDTIEVRLPFRAIVGAWTDSCCLCEIVLRLMRTHLAGSQINGAVRRVQQPRVCAPFGLLLMHGVDPLWPTSRLLQPSSRSQ